MSLALPKRDLILIVDDTPTNLAVMSETLTDAGFEIAIATSAKRALEQIQLELPDLILLDVMMPEMDGFEMCQLLQANDIWKHIPTIFMTARTDLDSRVQGLNLGAVDYITKPFDEQEVVARVNTHLELKKSRLKLQESEKRLNSILSSIKEVIWSANLEPFKLVHLNAAAAEIYGRPVEDLLNSTLWLDLIHPDDRVLLLDYFDDPAVGKFLDVEYRLLAGQDEVRWLHCQAEMSWIETAQQFRINGVVRDISDRKRAEQQLRHNAQHDSLTNLANRAYFSEHVAKLLQQPHQRRRDLCALLFIDLDQFKGINDNLGHGIGDQVLIQVGRILERSTREHDFIARLGGDEFTVVLTHLHNAHEGIIVSERIQANLRKPIYIEGQTIEVTASIGIVTDFSQYETVSKLLHHADLAMYQAKRLGKACHQLFEPEIYEQALAKQSLANDLKLAIQRHELQLAYQPIRILGNAQMKGFEALMRWKHPEQGMIPPSTFIPLAEETGLIIPLGECLLHLACQQICAWQERDPMMRGITMNLNISGQQLQHPNFIERVDQILNRYELSPSWFELEITESSLMEKSDYTLGQLQELRKRGFRLSLDDFGTGYSSLSYLHRFPIDTLKIDRSFVQTMEPDSSSFEIVRTIVSLAQTLQLRVVAEGVETVQQAEALKTLGCDMVQGYFFARPLDADAATQYLIQECQSEIELHVL